MIVLGHWFILSLLKKQRADIPAPTFISLRPELEGITLISFRAIPQAMIWKANH
jgi:hypothetical protein